MFKIYCERCWLIIEDIEIILLEKIDMLLCSGALCKCNDVENHTCNFDLALLITQRMQQGRI